MLYIVNFDIKDIDRKDLFTQHLQQLGECVLYMPKCYFLKTRPTIDGKYIYGHLKHVLQDEDLFLITKVDKTQMNGWLSNSTIDWLTNL